MKLIKKIQTVPYKTETFILIISISVPKINSFFKNNWASNKIYLKIIYLGKWPFLEFVNKELS